GLAVGTVGQATSDTVPAGDVIGQSPVGGTEVADGSAVGLTVSTGPAGATLHVGDLDGSVKTGKRNWSVKVTVFVHDDTEGLLADAVVSGTWSGGVTGSGSCVTSRKGKCAINSAKIDNAQGSVTFTVDDLSLAGYGYQPGDNHDPDGESDGTTVTLSQ
ncbi:MAG: PASTA domain-containing protein, partial [Alphaproteobacteria bacterium]|nr:PASTA domain-containing protein [Alphaproteobacteria bacterium]